MLELREYQQAALAELQEGIADGRPRQILSMPTGAGKTEIALALIETRCTMQHPALVVVEREVLVKQTKARFERHDHLIGVAQGENTFIRGYEPIIIASIQTLRSRWEKPIDKRLARSGKALATSSGLVVIDEVHILHEHHAKLMQALPVDVPVLGLTATPLRKGLGKLFQRVVVPTTIKALQADGYLVRAKVYAPSRTDIKSALEQIGVRAGDYIEGQLSSLMRQKAIIGDVVTAWQQKAQGKPTLCFCVDRAHARDLSEAFAVSGISSGYLDSYTPDDERQRLYAALRESRILVLCSVMVISIGFDEPGVKVAILARPTLSLALYIQQVGRVLRPYPGKDHALILDHAANSWRHGLPEDFVPPADLSKIDASWSTRTKRDYADVVTCKQCSHVYSIDLVTCPECGYVRIRRTQAIWLDGELQQVDPDHEPEKLAAGVTPQRLRREFCMMRWIAATKGWKPGAAYHWLKDRYRLQPDAIPRHWNLDEMQVPDDAFSRWFIGESQRRRIAWRYRQEAEA